MYQKVLETVEKNRMLQAGDKIIAAVSGGADSVCLLYVLNHIRKNLAVELHAVHMHHGIRGTEADRDAAFVKEICERWDVPVLIVYRDVRAYAAEQGLSLEESGRMMRYEVLEAEAEKWGDAKIAVAHHGDDNAETILHNLFRGSGLKGLGGIRYVRGRIIRPLLGVTRSEILDFLKSEGISWCEDSTNADNNYTRNKLRNCLLPFVVSEINAGAVSNIIHAGSLMTQADAYLDKIAGKLLEEQGKKEPGKISISTAVLQKEEIIIQTYLIGQMMRMLSNSARDITAKHIEEVQCLIDKPVGKKIDLPYALTAGKGYDCLWISVKKDDLVVDKSEENNESLLTFIRNSYEKKEEIPKNQYTKWFDYDKIKGMLSVRYRKTGDYITLASGGKKSIKSYMIDEKIPKEKRNRILLLAEENHVLWIIGYRISEYYKITEDTKEILQVNFNGGESDGR